MELLENGLKVDYGVKKLIKNIEHNMKMKEKKDIRNNHL